MIFPREYAIVKRKSRRRRHRFFGKGKTRVNEVEAVQHLQIKGLSIFVDTVDYRTLHLHKELELLWVMEGSLAVSGAQGKYSIGPGEMMLLGPNQSHEYRKEGKSCTFLCVQASPSFFEGSFPAVAGLVPEAGVLSRVLPAAQRAQMQALLAQTALLYFEKPPYYAVACTGNLHLVLYLVLQHAPHRVLTQTEAGDQARRSERLARLIDFVDENYMHKLRLSDFARTEQRSMSYLSHFVKENLGQTFQEYVNTVRFYAACKMIAGGGARLLDVCMACGFSDYRYFSQTFRARLGMTPEAYRIRYAQVELDVAEVHHSVHSLERFYTREQSLAMFQAFWRARAPQPLF